LPSIKAHRRAWFTAALLMLLTPLPRSAAQAEPQSDNAYRLKLPVDEVGLTFHAADAHGLPVNDLKPGEITLLDNGRPPRRILAFQLMQDFPIRAGILIDTSESMTPGADPPRWHVSPHRFAWSGSSFRHPCAFRLLRAVAVKRK